MKNKIIITGLTLLIFFVLNPAVFAHMTEEEALQKRANDLYDRIMCPICPGQTIAQSSNETSTQMRDLVLKKLRQGETEEQILQYFESRYGERAMAMPNKRGLNLILWFLPFLFVVLLIIVIYYLIRHWSAKGPGETVPPVEEAKLAEYEERLEKELKEFDEGF
jgi:cytochrome c-type biogenesis protein CcmH